MNESSSLHGDRTGSSTTHAIITADELALRLRVTRRALSNWPWLPRIKIGRSVRYIWPDVLITLKTRGAHTVTEEVGV